ncbi:unnamed protein product [Tilletia controversa]|uniref:Uncharacterized protein n=3 Tax=Tilletia TaxID=13289 RepID=A0A8X7MRI1_9BASI|nr:hypothetical protein CF335_g8543 [Tilletia laevis]KAE8188518.1 hypothetical protein CF328_g6574 [Tilletia controversa]KAE8240621.1 hypothetical protein A4X03_0g8468 [Tilletia caries]KAE8186458.1 hypothetical protein CF336_g6977 [Tilletia laevis]KAE8246112.1 hypothetical protein A4X06_0g5183 [Tilletia controversa]
MNTLLKTTAFDRALFRKPTAPITINSNRSTLSPQPHPMLAKVEWFMREWFFGVPPLRRIGGPVHSELRFPACSTNNGLHIPEESAFMPPITHLIISLSCSGWDSPTVTARIHRPQSQQAIIVEEVLEVYGQLGRKWSRLYGFFWYDDDNDEVAYTGLLRKEPSHFDLDFTLNKSIILTMSVDLH